MTPAELVTYLGLAVAIAGAVAVLYKLKPERDSLIITQTQGAATILNDLVDTLREEVQRERELRKQAHERTNAVLAEKLELERELAGLRARFGTRATDEEGDPP